MFNSYMAEINGEDYIEFNADDREQAIEKAKAYGAFRLSQYTKLNPGLHVRVIYLKNNNKETYFESFVQTNDKGK